MKKIITYIVLGLIITGGAFLLGKRSNNSIPSNCVLIKKSDLDSMRMVSGKLPDTVYVKYDTVINKIVVRTIKEIVYRDSIVSDSTRFVYSQAVNDEIDIRVNSLVQGKLLSSEIDYFLFVPKHITKTVYLEKQVPYFVQVQSKPQKYFVAAGVGGTWNGLAASGEIGILKGRKNYSIEAVRVQNSYLFLLKAGMRF